MKRFVLMGFFAVVLALGLLVGSALSANPQQKGFLFLGAKPSCALNNFAQEGTISPSTYRLVFRAKAGQLVGKVVLRAATPLTAYTVSLVQGGSDCHTVDGTLTTNGRVEGETYHVL